MFYLYNSLQIALCVVFRVGCLLVLEWGEYVYDDGWIRPRMCAQGLQNISRIFR